MFRELEFGRLELSCKRSAMRRSVSNGLRAHFFLEFDPLQHSFTGATPYRSVALEKKMQSAPKNRSEMRFPTAVNRYLLLPIRARFSVSLKESCRMTVPENSNPTSYGVDRRRLGFGSIAIIRSLALGHIDKLGHVKLSRFMGVTGLKFCGRGISNPAVETD